MDKIGKTGWIWRFFLPIAKQAIEGLWINPTLAHTTNHSSLDIICRNGEAARLFGARSMSKLEERSLIH